MRKTARGMPNLPTCVMSFSTPAENEIHIGGFFNFDDFKFHQAPPGGRFEER